MNEPAESVADPKSPGSNIERRTAARFRTAERVLVRGVQDTEWQDGDLADVSQAGARILNPSGFKEGSLVHVRVSFPNSRKAYEIYAKVIWSKPDSFGIRFAEVKTKSLPDVGAAPTPSEIVPAQSAESATASPNETNEPAKEVDKPAEPANASADTIA